MSLRYNKKKGKCCLTSLSIILLILSIGIIVASNYLLKAVDVPDEIKKDNAVFGSITMTGIVLAVYSAFGIFSLCGGCMIYVFSVINTILTILFLCLSCCSIIACFLAYV